MESIAFACSIILCVIGVATFVVGMNTPSKNDGMMMQKLDQAVDGIEDLKTDMKEVKDNQHKSDLKLQSHEDQIKTLFKMVSNNDHVDQALLTIMNVLNNRYGGETHAQGIH
jgi:hypothetical protein